MREEERALVRACIKADNDMPFDVIVRKTGLPPEKVSGYISDVAAENDILKNFFKDDSAKELDDPVESPWDMQLDDCLLDAYKKEMTDKTDKIKPLLIMKLYQELEVDKRIAQKKIEQLGHSPTKGSRWLELKLKARNEQIKLLGLDAGEKLEVEIGVRRSKEERDEIFKAAQAKNLLPNVLLP